MIRQVESVWNSSPTLEGAGVRLNRVFGQAHVPRLAPFLLLDDFSSSRPQDYLAGFPWHPHRGIETVTYMVQGKVEHEDSLGNKGLIKSGEIQWMTAGSGIIHQEMPREFKGRMTGFQLWVNLPSARKMSPPAYRDAGRGEISEAEGENSVVKVIAGSYKGVDGPIKNVSAKPQYLDILLQPGSVFEHSVPGNFKAFSYVLEGEGIFGPLKKAASGELVLFSNNGEKVSIKSGEKPLRFLLISGKPLGEPVAWHGPIVMNTRQELEKAFRDYSEGTFIRKKASL